ncbi:hypothetical protein GS597_03180 [Synechococcales cyanobacterium C]|uniref:Uncharacterized protein n=1 Tax=Petrachloros mirabilis ULC683 TaxID=2781853 RepID=A0A8K2A6Z5_9CYAN|nr:hypothetical protein [Petrachloros mirabilis ULC683]
MRFRNREVISNGGQILQQIAGAIES